MPIKTPNEYRVRVGAYASDDDLDHSGMFIVPQPLGPTLVCLAGTGMGWEHVSVSTAQRCPTWEEMCKVKDMFWQPEDCVMQLHPPKEDYVNHHPYCLHLWRPTHAEIPRPASIMVGPKAGS